MNTTNSRQEQAPDDEAPSTPEPANESVIRLPGRSVATRVPSLRSKGSHRGSLLSTISGRSMLYESKLEADVILCLLARPDVVDLVEQPSPIVYVDRDGRKAKTTFDALATLADGRRVLIAVKPREKALRHDFHAEVAHIGAQVPRQVATHVVVMDEHDVPRDALRDATLFHAVRRDPPSGADAAIRELTASMTGAASVASLVEASGLGAAAFRAIARLVADGVMVRTQGAPLTHASVLKRAETMGRAA